MLRILYITHYYKPEGNAPASRVHSFCRRWVESGHSVDVVTGVPNVPHGKPYAGYRNKAYQYEALDGVHVHRVWTFLASNKGFLLRVLNFLSFMLSSFLHIIRSPKKYDVVIATSPQFFAGWSGVLSARCIGVPLCLEVRDLWPDSILAVGAMKDSEGRSPSLPIRLLYYLEQRLYRSARHIVTVGDGYLQKLVEKGVPRRKISTVTNGVDLKHYTQGNALGALRDQFGIDENAFLIGYIGTVGMAHGLDIVIEAAALAVERGDEQIHFVVVGDGAERARLEEAVQSKQLKNVAFVGLVTKEETVAWLSELNACLVHLRDTQLFRTVLPSKMFEAFAMSCPILLGVKGEAARVLRLSGAGLCFEPEDPTSLLDAVSELSCDDGRLSAMQAGGRSFVGEHYDYDKLAQKYLNVLGQNVLRGNSTDRN